MPGWCVPYQVRLLGYNAHQASHHTCRYLCCLSGLVSPGTAWLKKLELLVPLVKIESNAGKKLALLGGVVDQGRWQIQCGGGHLKWFPTPGLNPPG
jgi:hypothetical protein